MNETGKIQTIFKIDGRRREPKSKQIINSVTEAIKKELIQIGERLPSLKDSLDQILAEPHDSNYMVDAVEAKLFGLD